MTKRIVHKLYIVLLIAFCNPFTSRSANDSVYIMNDTAYAQNLMNYGAGSSITMQALQGIVNRNTSSLFLSFNEQDHHDQDWMNLLKYLYPSLKGAYRKDLKWFLQHYKDSLKGYVLFDFADPSAQSTNVALGLSGLLNAIPIDLNATALIIYAQSIGLTQVQNAVGKNYTWLRSSTYWPLFNKNEIMMLDPTTYEGTCRDYGVAHKMAFFYDYTPADSQMTIMTNMCSSQNPGSRIYGWGYTDKNIPEATFSAVATNMNMAVIGFNWARNVSFYQHFNPSSPLTNTPMPVLPVNTKKHYAAIIMSDGDNVQAVMNHMTKTGYGKYDSPLRGQVPVGWSIPPTMYEYCNPIMQYLRLAATPNDVFIAGCNGWGYYYPSITHDDNLFASLNTQSFVNSDLHYMVDLDFTTTFKGFTNPVLDKLTLPSQIKGVAFNDYSWAGTFDKLLVSNNKPVVATLNMGFSQPSNIEYTNIANYINAKPANSSAFSGFTLIYAQLWTTTMTDLINLKNALDTNVVLVRPDVLFEMIQRNLLTTTGVENANLPGDNRIHCYPNPSSGKFTLETGIQNFSPITMEVYNAMGEKIISEQMEDKKIELNLSSQPKGIYFVRVYNEGKMFTDKIMLE